MKTFYRTLTGGSVMLLAFLFCSLFTACEEDEENAQIVVEETTYQIDATALEKTIEFEAKADWNAMVEYLSNIRANEEEEWLQLDKTHGSAGKVQLNLELTPNHTGAPRSANIIITCGGEKETIYIEQANVASGGGDEKSKRIKAIYGIIDSGNGYRDQWSRLEFKYDNEGNLIEIVRGAGKINPDETLEGERHFYTFTYGEGVIHTTDVGDFIFCEGNVANVDLGSVQGDEALEDRSFTMSLNADGDVYEMHGMDGYEYHVQYMYEDRKMMKAVIWGDNPDRTVIGTIKWTGNNMASNDLFGLQEYQYSNYLNNYNLDLNQYMNDGVRSEILIPSDHMGMRCENILDITNAQFDEDGCLISFQRNGTDVQHIVYEEAE